VDGQATSGDVQLDAHNEQAGIDLEIADRSGKGLNQQGLCQVLGKESDCVRLFGSSLVTAVTFL
jgi:hypothetical protein